MVERGRCAGHLTDPGEDGARRVDREADQPHPGRLGTRARRGAPPLGEGDLASILAANLDPNTPAAIRAGEDKSLTQGTAGWAALGATATANPPAQTNQDNGSHQYTTDQQSTDQHNAHELEDNR